MSAYGKLTLDDLRGHSREFQHAYISRSVDGRQQSLLMLVIGYFVLSLTLYFGFSVIQGFAEIPSSSSSLGFSVPHTIWGIFPMITIFVFATTYSFGPYYQVARIVVSVQIFFAVLVLDTVFHAAHLILAVVELSPPCDSLLCGGSSRGFLIALVSAEAFFIVWNIIIGVSSRGYVDLLLLGSEVGWLENIAVPSRAAGNKMIVDEFDHGRDMEAPPPSPRDPQYAEATAPPLATNSIIRRMLKDE